jgi:hypothetical protein
MREGFPVDAKDQGSNRCGLAGDPGRFMALENGKCMEASEF